MQDYKKISIKELNKSCFKVARFGDIMQNNVFIDMDGLIPIYQFICDYYRIDLIFITDSRNRLKHVLSGDGDDIFKFSIKMKKATKILVDSVLKN
jgi:hypothetical protein